MSQARLRLEGLERSRQRVQAMYDDYRLKLNDPKDESLGMREAMNQRQFMAQLLTLMQRVATDVQHTQNLLDSYKERLLEAERERIKMRTLADQNALAVQKFKPKRTKANGFFGRHAIQFKASNLIFKIKYESPASFRRYCLALASLAVSYFVVPFNSIDIRLA